MNMIIKFIKLSNDKKSLYIQVLWFLFYFRMKVKFLSFKYIKAHLGSLNNEQEQGCILAKQRDYALMIKRCIATITKKKLPWKCNCLAQALTAKKLLDRKNISCVVFLGVSKDKNNKVIAHAWTKVEDIYITGYQSKSNFVQVVKFI